MPSQNCILSHILSPNCILSQMVKNLPAVQKTGDQSLAWEDPLEKRMATHSSILAWRIPWTEEPGGLQSMGSQSQIQLSDYQHFHFHDYLMSQGKGEKVLVKLEESKYPGRFQWNDLVIFVSLVYLEFFYSG